MKNNFKQGAAALLLAGAVTCGAFAGGTSVLAEEDAPVFDEENIVLSFGLMSDLHFDAINAYTDNYKNGTVYLQSAVNFLKEDLGEDNLKAICTGGDSDNWNGLADIAMMKTALDGCLDPAKTEILPTPGNHDDWCSNGMEPKTDPLSSKRVFDDYNLFQEKLGDFVYQNKTMTSDEDLVQGFYHTVINGYHFLSVVGVDSDHTSSAIAWMKKELDAIRATADKGKPVFVQTHCPPRNTVYGTDASDGGRWTSTTIGKTLQNYPEVVLFTGHTHATINTPQAFWQTDSYTVINAGTLGEGLQFAAIQVDKNNVIRYVPYQMTKNMSAESADLVESCDVAPLPYAKDFTVNKIPEVSSEPVSEGSSAVSENTGNTSTGTSSTGTNDNASVSNTETGTTGGASAAAALALAAAAGCVAFCLRKKEQ